MRDQQDRYKLNLFYQGKSSEIEYFNAQDLTDKIFECENLHISTLAMDFKKNQSQKYRKELEQKWIEILPKLDNVTTLSVRHRVNQKYFDSICKMKNLERLFFWTSTVDNILNIKNLKKLTWLNVERFNRLTDISPILGLEELRLLSISNCFKIDTYDMIGKLTKLEGLDLSGDEFAPKNLRLKSLIPFETLRNLKHLDLCSTSVIDKSYDSILKMDKLERFDITVHIAKDLREKIKSRHKNLKAGFFMDWDYENDKFYDDKKW